LISFDSCDFLDFIVCLLYYDFFNLIIYRLDYVYL
jgi:hypothetical protein